MDYPSLKARTKPPKAKPRLKRSEGPDSKLLVSKLYSYLICHGDEDCRLPIYDVVRRLQKFSGDASYDAKRALEFARSSSQNFAVMNVEGKQFVEAKTSVKICDGFQDGKCRAAECQGLHICRFFLEGTLQHDTK